MALDQGRHRAAGGAEHQIAFPVARHGPVLCLGGSLADVDHRSDLAAASVIGTAASRPAGGLAPPQVTGELFAQRAAGLHEQRQVDRLVRHLHLRTVGKGLRQPTRDLLGRPAQLQLGLHQCAQLRVHRQLRWLRSTSSLQRGSVSNDRPVAASTTVAGDLSRHRRRRPPQASRNGSQRLARSDPSGDLLALSQAQPQRRPSPLRRRPTCEVVDVAPGRPPIPTDHLTDLRQRRVRRHQLRQPFLLRHRQRLVHQPPP